MTGFDPTFLFRGGVSRLRVPKLDGEDLHPKPFPDVLFPAFLVILFVHPNPSVFLVPAVLVNEPQPMFLMDLQEQAHHFHHLGFARIDDAALPDPNPFPAIEAFKICVNTHIHFPKTLVRRRGLEPLTSSMSRKRSTTELTAHGY